LQQLATALPQHNHRNLILYGNLKPAIATVSPLQDWMPMPASVSFHSIGIARADDVRRRCSNLRALRTFRSIRRSPSCFSMLIPAAEAMLARGFGKCVAMWFWRKRSSVQDDVLASASLGGVPSGLSEWGSPVNWVHRQLAQASGGFIQGLTGKHVPPNGPDRATILRSHNRPACRGCGNQLMLAHVFPIGPNHELRWFECVTCGYPLNVVAACSDPIDLLEDRLQYGGNAQPPPQRADEPPRRGAA
jgi:hypothetical protein